MSCSSLLILFAGPQRNAGPRTLPRRKLDGAFTLNVACIALQGSGAAAAKFLFL
jgi:hypothetical protein